MTELNIRSREVLFYRLYNLFSKTVILESLKIVYLLSIGYSFAQTLVMTSLTYAARLTFAVPCGVLSDRLNRVHIMYLSNILKGLGFLFIFTGNPLLIYLSFIVTGIGFICIDLVENSFLHDYCTENNYSFAKFRGMLKSEQIVYSIAINYSISILYMFVSLWIFIIPPIFMGMSILMLYKSGINPPGSKTIKTYKGVVKQGISEISKNRELKKDVFVGAIVITILIAVMKMTPVNLGFRGITGGLVGIIDTTANLAVFGFLRKSEICNKPHFEKYALTALVAGLFMNAMLDGYIGLSIIFITPIVSNLFAIYNTDSIARHSSSEIKTSMLSVRESIISIMVMIVGPAVGYSVDMVGVQSLSMILGAIVSIVIIFFVYQKDKLVKKENPL